MLPPGEQPPAHLNMPRDVREMIAASDTGCVLLWSLAESRLVVPPFPVRRREELSGWHTGPVQSILDRPRRTAVFLLRLGGYAIGVFEGEKLVQSKVGSRFVKGRHRAGGSSSGRFARRRENQARDLYDEACQELRTQLEPVQKTLEHFVLGGDRHTLQAFEKRCAFCRRCAASGRGGCWRCLSRGSGCWRMRCGCCIPRGWSRSPRRRRGSAARGSDRRGLAPKVLQITCVA